MTPQPHADSYYRASCNFELDAPQLHGMQRADVAVVGGGITGISAALQLAEQGASVALLEANDFAWGASGRSGGQILPGYSVDQRALERIAGDDAARELWRHSMEALRQTRARIERHKIACDHAQNYLHVAVRASQARDLQAWAEHMQARYGYELAYLARKPLREMLGSERYCAGVFDACGGHLHPLNYALGLARAAQSAGAQLYRNSRVESVHANGARMRVQTCGGKVDCEQVVYAGNAYLENLQPQLAKMIMPVLTYIIATEPLAESLAAQLIANHAAVADTNLALDYFRLSRDLRMLFGGRVSYSGRASHNLQRPLRRRMLRVFPQLAGARIAFAWGGKIAITRNRAPHIGQLSAREWYAHGFSGHGMALSGYAGGLLAEAAAGSRARLEIFEAIPHRAFFGGAFLRMPLLVAEMGWRRLVERVF